MPELPWEVSVREVEELIKGDPKLLLIDVREPEELALARIDGAESIPMRTIPERIQYLEDRDEPLIVFCHHGVRSLQVAVWLREHGVENAQSMAGGIDAWSRVIDASVGRY